MVLTSLAPPGLLADTGYSEDWIGRILLGHVSAPARFRSGLTALLEVDVDQLFD